MKDTEEETESKHTVGSSLLFGGVSTFIPRPRGPPPVPGENGGKHGARSVVCDDLYHNVATSIPPFPLLVKPP